MFKKESHPPRRGSAYVLVLGLTLLVTVVGMGTLMATRAGARQASQAADWEEAGVLAQAAVEDAVSYLSSAAAASPTTWRASYTSGVVGYTKPLGRGTISWFLKDEFDANLTNNYGDPFRLYGIGTVGRTKRVYSVQVVPSGTALDCLKSVLCADESYKNSNNCTAGGGPISTNGNANTGGTIYGAVECSTQSGGSGGSNMTYTTGVATKTMPSANVFSLYSNVATPLGTSTTGNVTITSTLLTPTTNPYGSTNVDGVYSIALGSAKTLTIQSSRIVGTLLITAKNATINITGPVLWEPARADYPILLVSGSNNTVHFKGSNTWLSEATVGVNFNPAGAPFQNLTDTDTADDLPPQYRGLICVWDADGTVQIDTNSYFKGTVLTTGEITTANQTTAVLDPKLVANPPMGFCKGDKLAIVPGTWLWDSPP